MLVARDADVHYRNIYNLNLNNKNREADKRFHAYLSIAHGDEDKAFEMLENDIRADEILRQSHEQLRRKIDVIRYSGS